MSEGGFAPMPGVPRAVAQQARSRLDPRVKAKLLHLEEHAETLLVAGRVLSDRVVTLRREIVDVERQVVELERDPLARHRSLHRMRSAAPGSTIVDVREPVGGLSDLRSRLAVLRDDERRLVERRDGTQARWMVAARLVTRARAYLEVGE